MLLFGALFLGILGLLFTPRQEDPQISVPMIDIFVQYPGASAQQVERLVTDPLERIMKEIKGVRHVYSATQRGAAIVTVRFEVGEEMGASIVKVHDKLQSNMDRMPPDVQMPLVKPVGVDDVPVVTLTLWSDDVEDHQLRKLGLDLLQAVGSLPDAGKGFVVGGREDQIRVEVLMERLAGHGITLDRIANTIQTANSELTTGVSESGDTAFNVYSGSFLRNAEDVGRLVIGNRGDYPLYLRDIATVEHVPQDTKQIVNHFTGRPTRGEHRADGAQAVTVAIAKKQGTNGVTVARQILTKVEELKTTLIPSNVHVEVTRDYGKSANDKVNELLQAMFEAAVIVSVLCLIGWVRGRLRRHHRDPGGDPADHLVGLDGRLHHRSGQSLRAHLRHRHPGRRCHRRGGEHLSPLARKRQDDHRDRGAGGRRGGQSDHPRDLHHHRRLAADGLGQRPDGALHAADPGARLFGHVLLAGGRIRLHALVCAAGPSAAGCTGEGGAP
jgi:multidrug efflux pump subunit AcrB